MFSSIKNNISKSLFFAISLFAFLISVSIAIRNDTGTRNLYIYQAEAFQHGRLDVSESRGNVAFFEDKYYVPFPPFPAILLLPIKTISANVNTTLISLFLTILNVIIAKNILKKLNTDKFVGYWLLLAFFLGTGYWLAVIRSSGVWYFAHVVSMTFVLLSIRETLGNGRGVIAGLFLGFAFLSRQLTIYLSIFIVASLVTNHYNDTRTKKVWTTTSFLIALGACVLVYLVYNYLRFGNPFDTGYSYLKLGSLLNSRVERFGLFNIAYVPINVIYMFFQGPHFEFQGTLIPQTMDPFGTSITFASPFLFFAFFAKCNKLIKISAWSAISISLIHMMLYYNNGLVQVNTQRFTLDFLPLLLVLVALSLTSVKKYLSFFYLSVVYSVTLNIIALLLFPHIKDFLTIMRAVL